MGKFFAASLQLTYDSRTIDHKYINIFVKDYIFDNNWILRILWNVVFIRKRNCRARYL